MTPHKTFPSLKLELWKRRRKLRATITHTLAWNITLQSPMMRLSEMFGALISNLPPGGCEVPNEITRGSVMWDLGHLRTNSQEGVISCFIVVRGLFYRLSFYSVVSCSNYKAKTLCYRNSVIYLTPPPTHTHCVYIQPDGNNFPELKTSQLEGWMSESTILNIKQEHQEGSNNSKSLTEA